MRAHELFAELASEKRINILQTLGHEPTKFTLLSEKFGMSSPESSRHLKRLVDANLIEKGSDGNYNLTLLGHSILASIKDANFIIDRSEYFTTHDTSPIPNEFLSQIDVLSEGEIVTGTFEIIATLDKKFDGVEEYFCFMAEDFPRQFIGKGEGLIEKGVKFRVIFPGTLVGSLLPGLSDNMKKGLDIRVMENINLLINVNDKYARVSLPGPEGVIDHNATILGSDGLFTKWCKQLFDHYWDIATPFKP